MGRQKINKPGVPAIDPNLKGVVKGRLTWFGGQRRGRSGMGRAWPFAGEVSAQRRRRRRRQRAAMCDGECGPRHSRPASRVARLACRSDGGATGHGRRGASDTPTRAAPRAPPRPPAPLNLFAATLDGAPVSASCAPPLAPSSRMSSFSGWAEIFQDEDGKNVVRLRIRLSADGAGQGRFWL